MCWCVWVNVVYMCVGVCGCIHVMYECVVEFLQNFPRTLFAVFLLQLNVREVIKPIRSVGSQSTDRRTVRGIYFQNAAASTLTRLC